jgi:hypothetical protein
MTSLLIAHQPWRGTTAPQRHALDGTPALMTNPAWAAHEVPPGAVILYEYHDHPFSEFPSNTDFIGNGNGYIPGLLIDRNFQLQLYDKYPDPVYSPNNSTSVPSGVWPGK